jgi:hypothetical protein
MSKIALTPNASGSGTFTIASPNSNTDRTLTLPDEAGTVVVKDGSNSATLDVIGNGDEKITFDASGQTIQFEVADSEKARFNSGTGFLIGTTNNSPAESSSEEGIRLGYNGGCQFSRNGNVLELGRPTSDGGLIAFRQAGTEEGNIAISGTTVSYNGGHLSRWSQLADNTRDESIVKGTVMSNLDQMAEWTHEGVTEDNEQLNCMKVSDVEGDADVAGVFVNWDNDDDIYINDMNVAMTGDMVIRIAQGTTVARGDLLMSAGDGTAKPQGDDIVRSKTIAKVTSTHVSHTYDDGSYLVPCVLMAC